MQPAYRAHLPRLRTLLAAALTAAALLLPIHTTTATLADSAAVASPYEQAVVAITPPVNVTPWNNAGLRLPNGNIAVADSNWTDGVTEGLGAVFLYDGKSGALISRLTGSRANDQVGSPWIIANPTNSTFLVVSNV
jgi:hypothetical protein